MSTHQPPHGGHKTNKAKRHERKRARKKMYKNLTADPRSGYKRAR